MISLSKDIRQFNKLSFTSTITFEHFIIHRYTLYWVFSLGYKGVDIVNLLSIRALVSYGLKRLVTSLSQHFE